MSPYVGKATAAERAALPVPASVCSIFLCLNNVMCVCVRLGPRDF